MRYTLLELTQQILRSLSSDEVDHIADTEESYTVANIIKECYFDIVGRLDLPEKEDIYQLQASGDSAKPCVMYRPEFAINIADLKYNVESVWQDVYFMTFENFLEMTTGLDTTSDIVGTQEIENSQGQTFTFKFETNRPPKWYTSFNDNTILFDAYDSSESATLVGARTLSWGKIVPTFTMEDDYTPAIDPQQFQLLLQAAKSQAFVELKQIENPKSERKERRNEINAQRTKRAVDNRPERIKYISYAR